MIAELCDFAKDSALPALDHAPIIHLAIMNVPAECTAVAHLAQHDARIGIVDHEWLQNVC
jgi:hypothetical protein